MTYVPKPVSRIYLCKKCRRAYLEEDIKAEHLTPEKLFEIIPAGMSPPQRRPYTQEDIDKALNTTGFVMSRMDHQIITVRIVSRHCQY
jgi:hypothetical protein